MFKLYGRSYACIKTVSSSNYFVDQAAVYFDCRRLAKLLTAVTFNTLTFVYMSLVFFDCNNLLRAGACALSAAYTFAFHDHGARL